jgi:hypothetical protein
VSFLPIPIEGRVSEPGTMTPTTTTRPSARWARIRRGIADAAAAQTRLWETTERIALDPDPYLHWEPTTAGWRLYGHLVPPD